MAIINRKTYFVVGVEIPIGMNKKEVVDSIRNAITIKANMDIENNVKMVNPTAVSVMPMSDNAYKHFFSGKEK